MKFTPMLASATVLAGLALSITPALVAIDAVRTSSITNQNAYMGYHTVDRKLVDPAYQDVAAKYKDDAGAQTELIKKMRRGGMGNWGQIPVPANPKITDIDLKTVIDWVLTGASTKRGTDDEQRDQSGPP